MNLKEKQSEGTQKGKSGRRLEGEFHERSSSMLDRGLEKGGGA